MARKSPYRDEDVNAVHTAAKEAGTPVPDLYERSGVPTRSRYQKAHQRVQRSITPQWTTSSLGPNATSGITDDPARLEADLGQHTQYVLTRSNTLLGRVIAMATLAQEQGDLVTYAHWQTWADELRGTVGGAERVRRQQLYGQGKTQKQVDAVLSRAKRDVGARL